MEGFCEPHFEAVRDAFAANLTLGDDLGASLSVYFKGRCVVDLFGGARADGSPYDSDTLQLLYSVTKGVTTICLMSLVDDGLVRLDDPVVVHWPEFGANGKSSITIRQLLGHRAGLPFFEKPVAVSELSDWDHLVSMLSAQAPSWPAGIAHGYHAVTFGYLVGELIRRATGKSAGTLLSERFATPMELNLHIGLPASLTNNVSLLHDAPGGYLTGSALAFAAGREGTSTNRAFNNPPIDTAIFNDAATWLPEIPGVNGIGDARSLARLYSTLTDGPNRSIRAATVNQFRTEVSFGPDLVLVEQPTRFGAGFMLSSPREPMLGEGSFGHNGRGGSLAFAHPESGVAFAYVGNRLIHDPTPHSRLWRLMAALWSTI